MNFSQLPSTRKPQNGSRRILCPPVTAADMHSSRATDISAEREGLNDLLDFPISIMSDTWASDWRRGRPIYNTYKIPPNKHNLSICHGRRPWRLQLGLYCKLSWRLWHVSAPFIVNGVANIIKREMSKVSQLFCVSF